MTHENSLTVLLKRFSQILRNIWIKSLRFITKLCGFTSSFKIIKNDRNSPELTENFKSNKRFLSILSIIAKSDVVFLVDQIEYKSGVKIPIQYQFQI